jgi:hypothetical protein
MTLLLDRPSVPSSPPVPVPVKTCTTCGRTLPATAEHFHRQKRNRDGLVAECKACCNARTATWKATHRARWNAYQRLYRRRKSP